MADSTVKIKFAPASARLLVDLAKYADQKQVTLAVSRGMRTWGEDTARIAKGRTPKDTGALYSTVTAFPSERKGDRVTLIIGAGGPSKTHGVDVGYAEIVHESVGKNINWNAAGTGPKYIENPINERAKMLPVEVNAELAASLKRIGAK